MLLKMNVKFNWETAQQESFNAFKENLIRAHFLQRPDITKHFILICDVSNYAIGSIFRQGELAKDLPVTYASRTLNTHEVNYTQRKSV